MSFPANLNLRFIQGATWVIPFQLVDGAGLPVPFSSCSGKLRRNVSDTAVAATFNCSVTDMAEAEGQAALSAVTTAALTLDTSPAGTRLNTKFFYDIFVVLPDGTTLGVLQGYILVMPEVDR